MDTDRRGVSIVQGELSLLLTATRRGSLWSGHARTEDNQDPLIQALYKLQVVLNETTDLRSLDVLAFLKPLCDIIQSDDTTGPVTGMAISSLEKFLAYGLIDPHHVSSSSGIESLSEAVTHARFVGTNPASDEVVLMKILQVLRTLMLSPPGWLLSNESVCEVMQSCFRICFEMRLSELLRCLAESTLVDMVQLLFSRVSSFSDDAHSIDDASSVIDQTLSQLPVVDELDEQHADDDLIESGDNHTNGMTESHDHDDESQDDNTGSRDNSVESHDQQGVSSVAMAPLRHKPGTLSPYSLPCVRELLRFLTSIINVTERNNLEPIVGIGLNLITVAIECGSTHLCHFPSLAVLVQDNLCKYLFSLLRHDNFTLFSRSLRCCYLLFECCRQDLKLQLEVFMNRLMELVSVEAISRSQYDRKELALECIVELCNLPHFTAELYVNYDCGLYCSNVFENLTKALSKNSFPTQGAIFPTHILSLDALLAINDKLKNSHVTDHMTSKQDQHRMKHNQSSPQTLNSAGLLFTISDGDVSTSPDQINMGVVTDRTHPLHVSDSLPALTGSQTQTPSHTPNTFLRTIGKYRAHSGYWAGSHVHEKVEKLVPGDGVKGEEFVPGDGVMDKTLPNPKELLEVRQRKKLILAGTEEFNKKPKQGIAFLMEQGIFSSNMNHNEVAGFLLGNHGLSKARIGEYVGERKNTETLLAFVSMIPVRGVPMVDALRVFLESFRLVGESPVVERILEAFSQHWLDTNADNDLGRQFANKDAVHVLTYAIMMLNTDLHSNQIKKKMTIEEFVRNQRGTNKKEDFPREFLIDIYHKIKEDEIIMPDEHTGTVKENYQWKVLLQRAGHGLEGDFSTVSTDVFDHDLFLLSWGPTVAALSYVFDNAEEREIVQKSISGFSKCASVAAHYELREVFDNLVISLCKFTTLLNTHESTSSLYFSLGVNPKVRLSVQSVFSLAHRYADILREGWKNLLDCLLALFKAKLLPDCLVEVSDFLHPEGKVSLYREEAPTRQDSSILSSLYSYWLLSNDQSGKALTPSELKARKAALKCIQECHPEKLFTESKFLRRDSLLELVKALTFASRGAEHHLSLGTLFDEDSAVFFIELLVVVAMENKDRVLLFWDDLSSHMTRVILTSHTHSYLLERTVVSLLRLSVRLLTKETMATQLLESLQVLLSLPPPSSSVQSQDLHKQTACGLSELVQSRATMIKAQSDWSNLFIILEYVGLGMSRVQEHVQVAMDTTSEPQGGVAVDNEDTPIPSSTNEHTESCDTDVASDWSTRDVPLGWVFIAGHDQWDNGNAFDLFSDQELPSHEPQAFFKVCEILSHLVRNEHQITADNFSLTVSAIRRFAEVAASQGSLTYDETHSSPAHSSKVTLSKRDRNLSSPPLKHSTKLRSPRTAVKPSPASSASLTYTTVSLQLLDLLDALYARVGLIFDADTVAGIQESCIAMDKGVTKTGQSVYAPETDREMAKNTGGVLWRVAWRPLLQGMARMCCDGRRPVRQTAITYFQRALLSHELQVLSAMEWQACFIEVFFPMLSRLLEDVQSSDGGGLEETRVRGSNLLCKVFLQHLPSLSLLSTFTALWVNILDFMDKLMNLESSDLLCEAIPESLKNMLLVMSTQGIFDDVIINSSRSDPSTRLTSKESRSQLLWEQTQIKVDKFLPNFLRNLFPNMTTPPCSDATPTTCVTVATAVTPITAKSPNESPHKTPSTSPLSTSPVIEIQTSDDSIESTFPFILHPPLPPPLTTHSPLPPPLTTHTPLPPPITTEPTSSQSIQSSPDALLKDLTVSLTGSEEEDRLNTGIAVPAPNVSGPILIPQSPPYSLADETRPAGMEPGHISSSPNSNQPIQFTASVYSM